jgi:hypothetical protein
MPGAPGALINLTPTSNSGPFSHQYGVPAPGAINDGTYSFNYQSLAVVFSGGLSGAVNQQFTGAYSHDATRAKQALDSALIPIYQQNPAGLTYEQMLGRAIGAVSSSVVNRENLFLSIQTFQDLGARGSQSTTCQERGDTLVNDPNAVLKMLRELRRAERYSWKERPATVVIRFGHINRNGQPRPGFVELFRAEESFEAFTQYSLPRPPAVQ